MRSRMGAFVARSNDDEDQEKARGSNGSQDLVPLVHESLDRPMGGEHHESGVPPHAKTQESSMARPEAGHASRRLAPLKNLPGRSTIAAAGPDPRRRAGAHTALGVSLLESLPDSTSKPGSIQKQARRKVDPNW